MEIAIASKGRAGKTKSAEFFEDCVLYVPEYEAESYLRFNKNVIPVPANVKGITKTRNFILNYSEKRYIIMIDDDLKNQGFIKVNDDNMKKIKLTPEDWKEEFLKMFSICEDINYKIWGVRTEGSPRGTYPYTPFLFHSYVTASCMGMINDKSYTIIKIIKLILHFSIMD